MFGVPTDPVTKASEAGKPVLRNPQLYQWDLSEFDDRDVDTHGLYGYPYLDAT